MPTKDVPSLSNWTAGDIVTAGQLNTDSDNIELYIQGVEDRLEESLSALHIDGVIWKRPGDVIDLIVSAGAGLSVNVTAGEALIGYRSSITAITNNGGTGGLITNGAANYCYLMQDGTLYFNVTGTAPVSQRNILLAKVTAAGGIITVVDNWFLGVVRGVGQPSLRTFTCTAAELVGEPVYVSGVNTVAQAQSDDTAPALARVIGVILAKETATSCIVASDGSIVTGTGLTTGSAYYLQTTAGVLGTGKPTAPDPIVPVGIAVSTVAMLVKVFIDESQFGAGGIWPAHAASHQVGGGDPLANLLDANGRVGVRRNSAGGTLKRRRLNLIEGAGVTIGISDDPGDEEVDVSIASSGTALHEATHEAGQADELPLGDMGGSLTSAQHGTLAGGDHSGDLTGNARVSVRKNSGGLTSKRRRINLIEGSNVTLTVADDAGDEEVDVTIAASAGAGGLHAADHETAGPDLVHFAGLEHSGIDATTHDNLYAVPHINPCDREAAVGAEGANLLYDGGFENLFGIGTYNRIWYPDISGGGVTPVRVVTDAKTGKACCQLEVGITGGVDYSQIEYWPDTPTGSVWIQINPGDAYTFRCWLNSAAGTETVYAFFSGWDQAGAWIDDRTLIATGEVVPAAWTEYTATLSGEGAGATQFPAGTTYGCLRIRQVETGGAGTLLVDDVSLVRERVEARTLEVYPDTQSYWVADGGDNDFGVAADSGTSEGFDVANGFGYVQVKNNGGDATADVDVYVQFQVPYDFYSLTDFKFWSMCSNVAGATEFRIVEILDTVGLAITSAPGSPITLQNVALTQDAVTVAALTPTWTKGGRVTAHLKILCDAAGSDYVQFGPIQMNYTALTGR